MRGFSTLTAFLVFSTLTVAFPTPHRNDGSTNEIEIRADSETEQLVDFLLDKKDEGSSSSAAGSETSVTVTYTATEGNVLTATTSDVTSTTASSSSTSITSSSSSASTSASPTPAPAPANISPSQSPRLVFAHFMVGIVSSYSSSNWERDMRMAQSYGIDGFALNVGTDDYTVRQLGLAYDAAQRTGFEVFISFDFNWFSTSNTGPVIDILRQFASHPAQHRVGSSAFVSTFSGDGFDWQAVRSALSSTPLYIVPNWQPSAENAANPGVDGMFSWYAWPSANNGPIDAKMNTGMDGAYLGQLEAKGKAYMAPVSPWFFTHFGKQVSYSKNWLFKSEALWYERWEQILDLAQRSPSLRYLEIITWNDYGESHYVGPSDNGHSDDGSGVYTNNMPHLALLEFARPYIQAFKSGSPRPAVSGDKLVYWYRPTLKSVASCDGSDAVGSRPNGWEIVGDTVFIAAFSSSGGSVTVKSGGQGSVTKSIGSGVTMLEFDMAAGDQAFSMQSGGRSLSGTASQGVLDACLNGSYNFNIFTGVLS